MKEIGVNIWWTIPEGVVPRADAVAAAKAFGFVDDDVPNPSRQLAVSRAVQSFHNRRRRADRRLGEKVGETMSSAIYGILDRQSEGSDSVSFQQKTTVVLDKASGVVTATGALASEYEAELAKFSGAITDDDVRTFLRRVIRMVYGVAKRPSGGIYFVPSRFLGIVESADKAMARMIPGARLYRERVVDGPIERQNIWQSVEEDVGSRVEDAVNAVAKIECRRSAVETQEEAVWQAKDLMEVYVNLLGEEAKYQGLAEKIEEAIKVVSAKMVELDKGNGQAAPAVPAAVGYNIVDAAAVILTKLARPLNYKALTREMINAGIYKSGSKTPEASVYAAVAKAIAAGDQRFKKVSRGVFAAV